MVHLIFRASPPEDWSSICAKNNDLFNTVEWQEVLSKGFGSRPLYGCDPNNGTKLTITVFKAGPFRIGYLGFPVGGCLEGSGFGIDVANEFTSPRYPTTIHAIRFPVGAFIRAKEFDVPLVTDLPETAILDLQAWEPEKVKKLRRDINKAMRSRLFLKDAIDLKDGDSIFDLYRETVHANKGGMRYSLEYFRALVDYSRKNPNLRCLLALLEDEIVGFEVVACHAKTAYSLHGGTNPEFRHNATSDLLTHEAISWAKSRGMESYNLMASPLDRPSLVKYKEKWGAVTRQQRTYELALKPLQTRVFNGVAFLHGKISSLINYRR